MWFQRILILTAAVAALAGSTWLAYLSRAQPPNDLTIEPAGRDFGRVSQNDKLPASFRIVNQTGAKVMIAQIIKTCDCTQPRLSQTTLGPRETATLDVIWEIGTRHGPSNAKVTLVTTSSARESGFQYAQLDLKADVQAEYSLEPESVTFEKAKGNGRTFVSFVPVSGTNAILTNVHPAHESVTVERDDKRSGFWLVFDATKWPADRDSAEVYVESSSHAEPRRRIFVRVE
jgi:hypothetical protein